MSTEGDQPTRAELIATAWNLSTQEGHSTRGVAREMGIPHSTARDYIREGVENAAWIDVLDRAEMSQTLAVSGMSILGRIKAAIDRAEEPDELAKLAPVWFKGASQVAQLLGLNAPTRVQNETVTRAAEPNPEIVASVRAAQQEAARRRAEIRGEIESNTDENGDDRA